MLLELLQRWGRWVGVDDDDDDGGDAMYGRGLVQWELLTC